MDAIGHAGFPRIESGCAVGQQVIAAFGVARLALMQPGIVGLA
jgi:hypothetical protein